ncbi:MAG: hypothetical protein WDZ74_00300 [Candidatus Paceibacterota bacterium]
MKSRLLKKFIAYGFLPFMVVFFAVSPLLGVSVAEAAGECNLVSVPSTFRLGVCLGSITSTIVLAFNVILGLFLYIVGALLDFAIKFSIYPGTDPEVGLGGLYRSETVNTAWSLLRDIINMSFIFILLYVAIGTVLKIERVDWKKQLSQIIIAAILVNFSLFITRVVIDAGNIVAHGFYTELTACTPDPCTDADGSNPRPSVGISERFVNALGIPALTTLQGLKELPTDLEGWGGVANGLMQTIVILVSIWVFFSVAILFIGRTFALVFILVLSPIGVAGASLPILGKFAQRWREELFKQSLLGVVFLFFIFVVLTFAVTEREGLIAADIGVQGEGRDIINDSLGVGRRGEGADSLIIMYMLVIAGLVMSLRLTKSLSGQAGRLIEGVGKTALGLGFGVAAGGAAKFMRGTFGASAAATLRREGDSLKATANDERASEKDRADAIRRYSTLKKRESASYDTRDTKFGGFTASKLGGVAGLNAQNIMKSPKGGRKEQIETEAKKINEGYSFEDLDPVGLRDSADRIESGGGAVDRQRAKELRKLADRKETSKEERDKKLERASGIITGGDDAQAMAVFEDLHSNELKGLTREALLHPRVLDSLEWGDLKNLSGGVAKGVWREIESRVNPAVLAEYEARTSGTWQNQQQNAQPTPAQPQQDGPRRKSRGASSRRSGRQSNS